ncbi:expressed unknown protein [Seminavis robusta]|uniref:Uncharacterized protein n=1 Tax=Seminavis robusta TaxID=568900 RepID=A0A9N8DT05_9STRA|nr:expressed unknown protein [Seminavis robusta]|eukprot:Sro349_g123580.1 n/a (471) ;mRNA; r:62576-63988
MMITIWGYLCSRIRERLRSYGHWCVKADPFLRWRELPTVLQQDVEFARSVVHLLRDPYPIMAALPELRKDRQLWENIVTHRLHNRSWHCLPSELREDVEFARRVVHLLKDPSPALQALRELREDREVWENIIKNMSGYRWVTGHEKSKLADFAPHHIRKDRELMTKAGVKNGYSIHAFRTWHDLTEISLLADNTFFANVVQCTIMWHDPDAEDLYLSLLLFRVATGANKAMIATNDKATWLMAREVLKASFRYLVKYKVRHDFWFVLHRDMAIAWFETGLPFKHNHPQAFRSHREFFLLIAEHCFSFNEKQESFAKWCNKELLQDKDFMVEVIKRDPLLYMSKFFKLSDDFDLAVQVICSLSMEDHISYWQNRRGFLQQLQHHLKTRLDEHKSFCHVASWGESRFTHLDKHLRNKIGEYLDQAKGAEQYQLRQRAHHQLASFLHQCEIESKERNGLLAYFMPWLATKKEM